jgi:hypothetical protein
MTKEKIKELTDALYGAGYEIRLMDDHNEQERHYGGGWVNLVVSPIPAPKASSRECP